MPGKKASARKKEQAPSCNTYCNKTFLPERERVEKRFAKETGLQYVPIAKLPKEKASLAKFLQDAYQDQCKKTYCDRSCGFAPTVHEARKVSLKKMGAVSVCRDFKTEFPKYYKNKV